MLQEIQKLDYDRYISLIFTPKDKREDVITVILFNLEIAKIKARVTEAMMGHIRFQWWREALDEVFDHTRVVRQHEIVTKLRILVGKYGNLNKNDFLKVIDAREKDLEENPFQNKQELIDYLRDTSYPVNKIIADIIGFDNERFGDVAEPLSIAWAITAYLRAVHKNFSSNRSIFPANLMEKAGIAASDFGSAAFPDKAKVIVKELIETATEQLQISQGRIDDISYSERKEAKPVYLFSKIAWHHINQIKKNDYDIFTRKLNTYLGISSLVKIYLSK